MSLSVGTKVGPYEILAPIGAGGMGEVYRAHDSRLNRDVAIKTLPAAFAEDADRMARFQREAQVLAALKHPHIAGIYGIESSAIVMELVEGHTLAGPVPIDEAIAIARQIADALDGKGGVKLDHFVGNLRLCSEGFAVSRETGLLSLASS
jgi:eukaryotic-like serine/threonine-protein kinase